MQQEPFLEKTDLRVGLVSFREPLACNISIKYGDLTWLIHGVRG